jgi:hypothetical protein
MKPEVWNRIFFSCDKNKVFGDAKVTCLSPEEIDEYCLNAGVVWEDLGDKEIHIHGCGIGCYCHGGVENKNLRPR